ncbi:MAG TPA: outer membrane beta-barrel protein [Verrucomicrobiae bacterium]|jgi:opacity protein-like surface antigen|nr:outer membrane beta-barrel protein [Verrucomicrobiae bacterium]
MKKNLLNPPLFIALLAGIAVIPTALQAGQTGSYFNADAGVSLVEDITTSVGGVTGKIKFNPGARFSMAGGYTFYSSATLSLSGEIETGLIYNSLDSASAGGASASLSGSYYQVPILGNAVLTLFPDSHWNPYVGVGGGMVYSSLSVDSVGGFSLGASSSEVDPAVQVMAGLRYKLGERSEIGVGYKYLATFPDGISHVGTHSLSASYTLHF